jgi:hypothetical protein
MGRTSLLGALCILWTAGSALAGQKAAPRPAILETDPILFGDFFLHPTQPVAGRPFSLEIQMFLPRPNLTVVGPEILNSQIEIYVDATGPTIPPPQRDVVSFAEIQMPALPAGIYNLSIFTSGEDPLTGTITVLSPSATCVPDATRLCLTGQRFEVQVDWTSGGSSAPGRAQVLTNNTGTFWFFQPANLELVVKVLDGCAINDHFWFFAAGLTNVATRIFVTDHETGAQRVYESPAGSPFAPRQDTAAFPCN